MHVSVRSAVVVLVALAACVPGLQAQAKDTQKAGTGSARVIQLTGTDAMSYGLATITAKPGEPLKVVLKVTSSLPPEQLKHNFVLLKPETDAMAYAMAAVMAKETGYMPVAHKDKVLVSTEMAAGGQEVSATFKAPAKPGTYPYVCTFPGHFFAGMKGSLIVK